MIVFRKAESRTYITIDPVVRDEPSANLRLPLLSARLSIRRRRTILMSGIYQPFCSPETNLSGRQRLIFVSIRYTYFSFRQIPTSLSAKDRRVMSGGHHRSISTKSALLSVRNLTICSDTNLSVRQKRTLLSVRD